MRKKERSKGKDREKDGKKSDREKDGKKSTSSSSSGEKERKKRDSTHSTDDSETAVSFASEKNVLVSQKNHFGWYSCSIKYHGAMKKTFKS